MPRHSRWSAESCAPGASTVQGAAALRLPSGEAALDHCPRVWTARPPTDRDGLPFVAVPQLLATAGHVALYDFDVASKKWVSECHYGTACGAARERLAELTALLAPIMP